MADNKIMTKKDDEVIGKTKALYFAEGTISVKAKGYWYSNGGIKGSFGYYPHLKDCEGFPIFPDTQIKGNLQMAVKWYSSLSQQKNLNIDKIFGKEDYSDSSLFKITDLVLTDQSKKKWLDNGGNSRFQIKTRIKIDFGTKTVAEHCLVDFESAFLDDLMLESKFYLGYFTDEKEFENAVYFIQNAVYLLPGFGAFRSRGFGRGNVSINFNEGKDTPIIFSKLKAEQQTKKFNNKDASFLNINSLQFNYFITSLVNIRNKRPGSGTLQNVETINYILESQLRSWFIKTWFNLFGNWPDYNNIKRIKMQPLYYADLSRKLLFCPPPVTTLIDEEKNIKDMWRNDEKKTNSMCNSTTDDGQHENYVRSSKTKPLSSDYFVTRKSNDDNGIEAVKINREQRMRNKLDDHFVTGTDSLFVQELIPKGICFGTTIQIEPIDASANNAAPVNDDFLNKAIFIFKNINPIIKGAIFEPTVIQIEKKAGSTNTPSISDSASEADKTPLLVVHPIPYSNELMKSDNSIRLSSTRNYNTVLKRHKRNRIVIETSSVITSGNLDLYGFYCIDWKGFGKTHIPFSETQSLGTKDNSKNKNQENSVQIANDNSKNEIIKNINNYIISNSQAGFLRELLNEKVDSDYIEKILKHRLQKYKAKNEEKLSHIIEEILNESISSKPNKGIDQMRMLITQYLETLGVAKWDLKKKQKENTETKKDTKEVEHGTK